MTPAHWLTARTAQASPVLRARVLEHLAPEPEPDGPGLARAGERALASALDAPARDRSAALDLLAADALITLALLHQAERDPEGFEAFATTVFRQAAGPGA